MKNMQVPYLFSSIKWILCQRWKHPYPNCPSWKPPTQLVRELIVDWNPTPWNVWFDPGPRTVGPRTQKTGWRLGSVSFGEPRSAYGAYSTGWPGCLRTGHSSHRPYAQVILQPSKWWWSAWPCKITSEILLLII